MAPVHPPDAAQAVAFVEFQANCALPPLFTVVGLALKLTVGLMLTVTLATLLVPPGPEHVSEYTVGTEIAAVICVPLVA